MNQSLKQNILTSIVYFAAAILASLAWFSATNNKSSLIAIAGLLGLIGFSMMWGHYMVDWLRSAKVLQTKEESDVLYVITRVVVLAAILIHPIAINLYLYNNNYGLPPNSYKGLLGAENVPYVFIAMLALLAFLAFEVRGYFGKYKHIIFHANILAMFLIFAHGFKLGAVVTSQWFVWVWSSMLILFSINAVRLYKTRYTENMNKKIFTIGIVIIGTIVALGIGLAAYQSNNKQSSDMLIGPSQSDVAKSNTAIEESANSQSSSQESSAATGTNITKAQLASNNGLNGAKCWIAHEGKVYDASNNSQWKNGEHTPSRGQAKCGQDLTEVLKQAPHGTEVFRELTLVGNLQ